MPSDEGATRLVVLNSHKNVLCNSGQLHASCMQSIGTLMNAYESIHHEDDTLEARFRYGIFYQFLPFPPT